MSFAVMMAAATVASAAGTYAQGQAQADAYNANATAAEQQARAQREKASHEAGLVREQGQSILSTQRARYGASGVAMSGSALDVALGTARKNELDALMTKYNGEVNARQSENQAAVYRSQADNAKTAGTIGAITTLLTGGAQIAGAGAGMGASGGMGASAMGGPVPTMEMMTMTGQPDPFRWRIPGWN